MRKFNFKEYVNSSGKIHVDKVKGKQASSTLIAGDQRVVMTMLASMIEVMLRNEVFKADDFREIIDIVEKGIKELESK